MPASLFSKSRYHCGMDIPSYLRRIDFSGPTPPTLETLRALHRAHLEAVPFENLDISLGRPIRVDREAFFDKIVNHWRGGFCYEQNGLFSAVLEQLGYRVTLLSASDAKPDGTFGLEFDHLTLQVEVPGVTGAWLADVGWGDTFREPLRIEAPGEQHQDGRAYWFERDEEYYILNQREGPGAWKPGDRERQYRFALQPHALQDFAGMCRYHQTSPRSSFTRERLATLALPHGRITLVDLRLIETIDGQRTERMLSGEEERRQVLKERFKINLGS